MSFKEFHLTRRMIIILVAIPVVLVFLGYGAYYNYKGTMEMREYHFDGAVDSVTYDIKGAPSVIIKGSHFYLGGTAWNFGGKVLKGDTLIKNRNSMIIKLVKRNGQILIEGDRDH